MYLQAVKEKYDKKHVTDGPHLPVEFEASSITLELPDDGVALGEGWKLLPLFYPEVRYLCASPSWSELLITNSCSYADY